MRLRARNDLLHVDSFPTRPVRGDRILRVFDVRLASENQLNSPLLNRILTLVFELDLRTAPSLALPFGVSIFAIAEKPAVSNPTGIPND